MGGREVEKMGVIVIGRNRALQGRGRQETVKEKVSQGRIYHQAFLKRLTSKSLRWEPCKL